MVLAEWSNAELNMTRVVQMLMIHDLVEIDCGDTPLFEEDATASQLERERAVADRIYGILPDDQASALRGLREEFEEGMTPEGSFAKAVDRLQPVILNHLNRGGTWDDYQADVDRKRKLTRRIADGSKDLWTAAEAMPEEPVAGGWLLKEPPGSADFAGRSE